MKDKSVSFLELLGLLLVGLKLHGSIEWSWWAVLCPLYVPWSVAFVTAFVVAFVKERAKRLVNP